MPTPYLLLEYDYVPDILTRREPVRAAHLAGIQSARATGALLTAGAVGDPPTGALFVWAADQHDAITAFVAADPYVREGLVTAHRILPWTVVAGAAG